MVLTGVSLVHYNSHIESVPVIHHERSENVNTNTQKTWRMSISMDKEMEEAIVRLRQDSRFTRMSFAEIIRLLLEAGIKDLHEGDHSA